MNPLARALVGLGLLLALCAPAGAAELSVESILPTGRVERLSQVVVRFSRDMRPLGEMDAGPEAPLSLEPRPPGSLRWLDPRTLAFILDQPLAGAARLSLTVPAGARALDGSRLARPVRATVHTPPIEVTKLSPEPGSRLGPRPRLRLFCNQPVELPSLARRAYLSVAGRRIRLEAAEEPLPEWQRESLGRAYLLTPRQELPRHAQARLVIEAGLRPARGWLPLQKGLAFPYATYRRLRLAKWSMQKAPGGGRDPRAALVLEFSNPVVPRRAARRLSFSPPLELDPEALGGHPSRWLHLEPGFEPRTAYTLSVLPGIKDSYGTTLNQGLELDFRTGDLPPVLDLAGGKGVLEAKAPARYPLRVRNLPGFDLGLKLVPPEEAVPALVAEAERPWDQKPPAPRAPGWQVARRVELELEPNRLAHRPLDLERLLGNKPLGSLVVADLRATWPDGEGKPRQRVRRAVIQVTGLGLALKLGESGGAAWVTGLAHGRPLAGVELELRDRANRVLWKGASDAEGLARLPGLAELAPAPDQKRPWRDPVVYLLARREGDLAVLPSQWGQDLWFSLPPGLAFRRPGQGRELLAHSVTQLPLYQPGQTVRLAVYLRRAAAAGLEPVTGEVEVQVQDPYGRAVHTFRSRPSAFGSLAGELELTPGARLGRWGVFVRPAGGEAPLVRAGGFRVASFRPPDFRVQVSPPDSLVGEKPSRARLAADYLFGAPVAGGRAKVQVEQRPTSHAPPELAGWAVGDIPPPGEDPGLTRRLATLEAELDARGRAELELPAPRAPPGRPVVVETEAAVADAAGLTVSSAGRTLVHPAGVYLGLKTPVVAEAGQPARVELAAAAAGGGPAGPLAVRLTVLRQVWETVRERGPGGFWRYHSRARREKVWSRELALTAQGGAASFTPPQAGTYLVVAEAADAQGRTARSAAYLWAAGGGLAGWQRFDDHRLELKAEPAELAPGQSARILIQSPFARATALVSLEREGVRRLLVRRVSGPAPVVEIPVSAADAPNLFVGVLLVRGRVGEAGGGGLDLAKPQVRLGYAELKVRRRAGLAVEVATDRDTYRPGQEVSARVRVSRAGGGPARAEVLLLAVDERVLAAAGEDSYDPRETFGRPRPLAVITADGRTQVVGRRNQEMKGDAEAGGGGLGRALRQRFHPAVFWLAQAVTDPQGRVRASFRLPDSLTAYRVVAVAAGEEGGFGLGRAGLTARQPLQMLSALPRFAVEGDRFSARVTVQNLTDSPARVEVGARAEGLRLVGPASRELELAAGASRTVGFSAEALAPGGAALTVRARSGGREDAARFTLPVLAEVGLRHAAAAGALRPAGGRDRAETPVLLPAGARPGRGGLSLTVAPSAAAGLGPALRVLEGYPWDCLEQRLSRAAALGFRLTHGARLGWAARPGDRRRAESILASAADYQTGAGGFALWPGGERPDLFLTAYALAAARRLAAAGLKLGPEVKRPALDYLARELKQSPAPRRRDLAARTAEALALAVLAAEGHGRAGPLLQAALARGPGLGPFGLACLLQAARGLDQPAAAEALVGRLEASQVVEPRGMHFAAVDPAGLKPVMGSTLRANAAALSALAAARPDYPRLAGLAGWVARRLGENANASTQEAVFGLWGLADYLAASGGGGPVAVAVSLDGRELAAREFAAESPALTVEVERALLEAGRRQSAEVSARGRGAPVWTARLSWAPAEPPERPVNAGLTISRAYQGGAPRVGEEVECVLTVLAPETRHHVLVHDPFPAGLEPVGAEKGAPRRPEGEPPGPWRWQEPRRDGLLLYAPELAPGLYTYRYRLRAVAPGGFVLRPARAEEMYAPEVHGATAAGRLVVR